jgi:hypothetical protein
MVSTCAPISAAVSRPKAISSSLVGGFRRSAVHHHDRLDAQHQKAGRRMRLLLANNVRRHVGVRAVDHAVRQRPAPVSPTARQSWAVSKS